VGDPAVARAVAFMRENLERPLKPREIAAQVHMHERTFLRHFQKAVGRNPTEELVRMRLDKARALLLETDDAVYEISDACGFGNTNRFGRRFKAETGMTPTAFRKTHRPEG
jgi:transcriptional regulator GlxA family with amidase domain